MGSLNLDVTKDGNFLTIQGPDTYYLKRDLANQAWRWDPIRRWWYIWRSPSNLDAVRALCISKGVALTDHLMVSSLSNSSTSHSRPRSRKRLRVSSSPEDYSSAAVDSDYSIEDDEMFNGEEEVDQFSTRRVTRRMAREANIPLTEGIPDDESSITQERRPRQRPRASARQKATKKPKVIADESDGEVEIVEEADIETILSRKIANAVSSGLIIDLS